MAIGTNKMAEIRRQEVADKIAKAEWMVGGIKATVMNYTKKGEAKYYIQVCGTNPELKRYNSRIEFLKELEKRI